MRFQTVRSQESLLIGVYYINTYTHVDKRNNGTQHSVYPHGCNNNILYVLTEALEIESAHKHTPTDTRSYASSYFSSKLFIYVSGNRHNCRHSLPNNWAQCGAAIDILLFSESAMESIRKDILAEPSATATTKVSIAD